MKNENNIFYTLDDVLQILIDFYNYQSLVDPNVNNGFKLTFEMPIEQWRNICDLSNTDRAVSFYKKTFNLKEDDYLYEIFENREKNLMDFCFHISKNSKREIITPSICFGKACFENAIYKIVKRRLKEKGFDVTGFKPNSELSEFLDRFGMDIVEIVSLIAPGTIKEFKIYKNNTNNIKALVMILISMLVIMLFILFKKYYMLFVLFAICAFLILLYKNKHIKNYYKYNFNGFVTVRDLIIGMKKTLSS